MKSKYIVKQQVKSTMEDVMRLQRDLDEIAKWCKTWSMELNADKGKIMNIGGNDIVGWERKFTLPDDESSHSKRPKKNVTWVSS